MQAMPAALQTFLLQAAGLQALPAAKPIFNYYLFIYLFYLLYYIYLFYLFFIFYLFNYLFNYYLFIYLLYLLLFYLLYLLYLLLFYILYLFIIYFFILFIYFLFILLFCVSCACPYFAKNITHRWLRFKLRHFHSHRETHTLTCACFFIKNHAQTIALLKHAYAMRRARSPVRAIL